MASPAKICVSDKVWKSNHSSHLQLTVNVEAKKYVHIYYKMPQIVNIAMQTFSELIAYKENYSSKKQTHKIR